MIKGGNVTIYIFLQQFQLFDQVKQQRGLAVLLAHCVVVSGDCTMVQLGISPENRQLITDTVSIIYHCAATIRFDEGLKTAVLLNTRGTKFMLELANECKHLEVSAATILYYMRFFELIPQCLVYHI